MGHTLVLISKKALEKQKHKNVIGPLWFFIIKYAVPETKYADLYKNGVK